MHRTIRQRLQSTFALRRGRRLLASTSRASVAIEFAILAPVFAAVMLGIVDTGLLLTSQAALDGATQDAARLIRTGQVAANSAAFANQLCAEVSGLMTCANLTYRVQTGDSFASMPASYKLNASGAPVGFAAYPTAVATGNPGGSLTSDFVVVQVAYQRPWLFTMLGTVMGHSTELLLSTVAFENEPVS